MKSYEIVGGNLPAVICELSAGESMLSEAGAMSWMSSNMKMETTSNGGIGKALGRMFSGESLFLNRYTAEGREGMIAFASSFPGTIRAIDLNKERSIIVQKAAFLASDTTVELSMFFQKNLGKGLFGGEGFIMQKLTGSGTAFIEIDGYAVEYDLPAGEQLVIDTGYLVAMDESCTMDVVTVPGIKNILFGGEGLFNTVVKGPGKVILQTMPITNVAGVLAKYMPMKK
ncbi:MAG: TIGR00266 family protein [Peptostreptococcaceae bacterium]|nr:TIGR00266 family protein [Peptostreptococcaceae bacterium]